MYTILLNIVAYAFMTIILGFVLNRSAQKGGLLVFMNFLFFAWSLFMVFYLIVDYKNIIALPLNERLSFFETVTNFLAPACILVMYLNMIKR